jgi:hypothetical protein
MLAVHKRLTNELTSKQFLQFRQLYQDQSNETPKKSYLLCEYLFLPYADYISAESPINEDDIEWAHRAIDYAKEPPLDLSGSALFETTLPQIFPVFPKKT